MRAARVEGIGEPPGWEAEGKAGYRLRRRSLRCFRSKIPTATSGSVTVRASAEARVGAGPRGGGGACVARARAAAAARVGAGPRGGGGACVAWLRAPRRLRTLA